jgi:transposase-like protein
MDANYKPYKRYDDEFKRNAVELLESSGRSISEVSGDLGIPYKTLERWRYKYRPRDGGGKPANGDKNPELAMAELAELKELRRRLAHTERERDILKKALAIFSREEKDRGGLS